MSLLWFILLVQATAIKYNETRAVEYAKLAGAAYCWESSIEKWDCGYKCTANVKDVMVCSGNTVKSFVAHWDGNCLLAVRGTYNFKSALTDLKTWKSGELMGAGCTSCEVHSGFLDEWNSMLSCVKSSLTAIGCGAGKTGLYVTGHSLGAGIAGIAMMSLNYHGWTIAESYNFGMPRTGDVNFATQFNQKFSDRFFRVTHHKDPVPQVPPSQLIVDWHFEHVSPEIFYKGVENSDGYTQCDEPDSTSCSGQYSRILVDLLHIDDHLSYMEIDTGMFGCPSTPSLTTVTGVVV